MEHYVAVLFLFYTAEPFFQDTMREILDDRQEN